MSQAATLDPRIFERGEPWAECGRAQGTDALSLSPACKSALEVRGAGAALLVRNTRGQVS
jgi:hypothetical protein